MAQGETDHNRAAIIQGWIDTDLNDEGRLQCVELGRHFRETGVQFDAVYSSDLKRASDVRASDEARLNVLRLPASSSSSSDRICL